MEDKSNSTNSSCMYCNIVLTSPLFDIYLLINNISKVWKPIITQTISLSFKAWIKRSFPENVIKITFFRSHSFISYLVTSISTISLYLGSVSSMKIVCLGYAQSLLQIPQPWLSVGSLITSCSASRKNLINK